MEQYVMLLVTAVVGLVTYGAKQWLTVKLGPERLSNATALAQRAVIAAERVKVGGVKLDGPTKYEYASTALTTAAKAVGIKLKPEVANALIHSALAEVEEVFEVPQSS